MMKEESGLDHMGLNSKLFEDVFVFQAARQDALEGGLFDERRPIPRR
jgi:hypothetical protein